MANDRTTTSNTSNSGAPQPTSEAQESRSGEGEPAPESEGKQGAGTRALKGVSAPLWWIEKRVLDPIATWLSNLAFLQILEYLGKLAIVVAVITWIAQSGAREREANYEAWRVINSAQGQEGSGGRVDAIENLYIGEESLVGLSAEDAFLAKIDLFEEDSGLFEKDIGGAELDSANFQKADLGGADLQEASLWRAVLRGAYLGKDPATGEASDLGGADLSNSDLRESDLTKANLAGANLSNANLTEATLAGADLQGANLWESTFVDANLRNADLRNTNFGDYANLQRAVLVGADLRGAKLGGVSLLQTNVSGADFRETKGLTQEIINQATGSNETKLPEHLSRPQAWKGAAQPLVWGSLGAGRRTTGVFTPSATFEVGKGWQVSADETKDSLAITREEHMHDPELSFVNVDEVFHADNPIDPDDPIIAENAMPAPDDLVGWFKTHPHLEVVSEKKVTVGGASGVQLDAFISSAPENHPADCDGPCVAIFANTAATYYYPGFSYRFIILNLGMETVAIVINSLAAEDLQLAETVLDTVVWSERQLLPEEEISSKLFKPNLSFASGGFWTVLYETTDIWQFQEPNSFWYFSFVSVDKIRDPQDPTDKDKVMPIPNDDLVGWLKGHPHLNVTAEQKVRVGGITGTQLDVSVLSTPKNDPADCGGDCLPLFHLNDGSPFWLWKAEDNRLIVLRIKGETVVVSIETPPDQLDEFWSEAQTALSTVKWRS